MTICKESFTSWRVWLDQTSDATKHGSAFYKKLCYDTKDSTCMKSNLSQSTCSVLPIAMKLLQNGNIAILPTVVL